MNGYEESHDFIILRGVIMNYAKKTVLINAQKLSGLGGYFG